MENEIKILVAKLDKVLEQQELILKTLDNKIILNSDNRVESKQERQTKIDTEIQQHLREMFALKPDKHRLQKEFNLVAIPHSSRVKAYLKTNDPSVFDGLKRNGK